MSKSTNVDVSFTARLSGVGAENRRTSGPEEAACCTQKHLKLFFLTEFPGVTGNLFGLGKRIKFRLNSSFLQNVYKE